VLDDDELMALLGDVLDAECAVPADTLTAAQAAFALRNVDEELADLLFDSADVPVQAGVRGPADDRRQVTYQSADLLIECEIGPSTLVGQLLPPTPVTLELMNSTGSRHPVDVDAHGRFVVPLPRPGPIRLRCRQGSQPDVLTPWLLP
jgi:hypothetical protein